MSKRGRPPAQQVKTAYDYHRAITLVQVLAMSGSDEGIRALCQGWGVKPVVDPTDPRYIHVWSTIRLLAQHALEHAKER